MYYKIIHKYILQDFEWMFKIESYGVQQINHGMRWIY